MGLMGALVLFFVCLVWLSSIFTLAFAYPSKYGAQRGSLGSHQAEVGPKYTVYEQETVRENQETVNTVLVTCHPDFMAILVKADLFDVGVPINGEELRLGVGHEEYCRSTPSSDDEYKIVVGLSACGTKHWMTEDSLIYTNLLIYSPVVSPDGVIRMDEAVIPVECHYNRKYSLSSSSLLPTWIPFMSSVNAVETLALDLRLMTTDWLHERSSNVFHVREPICMEASVRVGHHMGLRVFISSCVATLEPDQDSSPRYDFIENDGCLVDSQQQGSHSQFLPRTRNDKLQLVVDAFRFNTAARGELYITCVLGAVPVAADATQKACTFSNGRWWSADGNDYSCGYCQRQNELSQTHGLPSNYGTFGPHSHGRPVGPTSLGRGGLGKVWENERHVGPLLFLPGGRKSPYLPAKDVTSIIAEIGGAPLHGSKWRSGINMRTDWKKGLVPETSSTLEPEVYEDETTEMVAVTPSEDEDWSNDTALKVVMTTEENVTAISKAMAGSTGTPVTTSSKDLIPATFLQDKVAEVE